MRTIAVIALACLFVWHAAGTKSDAAYEEARILSHGRTSTAISTRNCKLSLTQARTCTNVPWSTIIGATAALVVQLSCSQLTRIILDLMNTVSYLLLHASDAPVCLAVRCAHRIFNTCTMRHSHNAGSLNACHGGNPGVSC